MVSKTYTKVRSRAKTGSMTPQMQPIPGLEREMAKNNAGGFTFVVDDWKRLERFLILGSEGGTYYVDSKKLTDQNVTVVDKLIAQDGRRVVDTVVAISEAGRAPKQDPSLFVLARALATGDRATKLRVHGALPKVARIGTHLFTFVQFATQFRGWGRSLRDAVANWYVSKDPQSLAYQAIKYPSRVVTEGETPWTNRDLLRLSHAHATGQTAEILRWMVKGWPEVGDEPHPDEALRIVWATERVKKASSVSEVVKLIRDYNLPREVIPTEYLKNTAVWAALLEKMPMTAMIRNLSTMTRNGLLVPMSDASRHVVRELTNVERVKKSRVHPVQILSALKVYGSGGVAGRNVYARGGQSPFTPEPQIKDALNEAFYAAFGSVEPTGKRILLGLDISASMDGSQIAGLPGLTARDGTAAMAMVTARSEWSKGAVSYPMYHSVAFTSSLVPFELSPTERLDKVIERMRRMPHGGTDCALPMHYALERNIGVDTFIIYTDNETWAGGARSFFGSTSQYNGHPYEALAKYRKVTGIPAQLIVVGFTATEVSIAKQDDPGMLDVVGFDSAAPAVMSEFIRGNV